METEICKPFRPNIELDAEMVLVAIKGGMPELINWAFMHRDIFPKPDIAIDRANWLKAQSEKYIIKVSKRTAELERQ